MESRVRPRPVEVALVPVAHLVLDVAHLVVDGDKVLLVDPGALLDAEVLAVVEVPRAGVAGQVAAVGGLLDDAAGPEFLWSKANSSAIPAINANTHDFSIKPIQYSCPY